MFGRFFKQVVSPEKLFASLVTLACATGKAGAQLLLNSSTGDNGNSNHNSNSDVWWAVGGIGFGCLFVACVVGCARSKCERVYVPSDYSEMEPESNLRNQV